MEYAFGLEICIKEGPSVVSSCYVLSIRVLGFLRILMFVMTHLGDIPGVVMAGVTVHV